MPGENRPHRLDNEARRPGPGDIPMPPSEAPPNAPELKFFSYLPI
jgi:hypothetical protein